LRKFLPLSLLAGVFLLLALAVPGTSPAEEARMVLEDCGWQAAEEFTEEVITLPAFSDATWRAYLALQKENGMDMEPYGGREVLKLTCRISEYPAEGMVYANLYWCDGRIIGGDIMSPALGGFMHGLKKPPF